MTVGQYARRTTEHHQEQGSGTVTRIEYPTQHVLRFTAVLPEADPAWAAANVTLRLELGPAYDDASRVYTVRRFDPAQQQIEVDVVLHGLSRPMMRWASELEIGQHVQFRGPRQHFVIPDAPERPVALFLDSTAIPAVHAILEQWGERAGGIGWVETSDAEAFSELPSVPQLELHRIESGLLARGLALPEPERYVVWGAGEREDMRALRSHFRTTVGLPKEHVALYGY